MAALSGVRGLAGVVCMAIAMCISAHVSAAAFKFTELTPPYLPPSNDAGKSIVTGDFNHDGKTDVAFATSSGFSPEQQNCAPQGCVSVLLGKGDATFASVACQPPLTATSCPVNYPTGGEPYFGTGSLAEGDLNRDGNTDLVVANVIGTGNCNLGCVSILYGNSNGTFQAPIEINTGTSPEAVVVGDFNGDGRPDIAVASFNSMTVLLNQGNDAAATRPSPPRPAPRSCSQVIRTGRCSG